MKKTDETRCIKKFIILKKIANKWYFMTTKRVHQCKYTGLAGGPKGLPFPVFKWKDEYIIPN